MSVARGPQQLPAVRDTHAEFEASGSATAFNCSTSRKPMRG